MMNGRASARRVAGFGAVAAVVAASAAMLRPDAIPPPPASLDAARPALQAAAAPPAPAIGASFDVARLGARGDLVVAGRGPPGAEIVLMDVAAGAGNRELARTRADARGEWVMLPDVKLPAGVAELALAARGPDGNRRGGDTVVLVVPPPAALLAAPGSDPAAPIALLLPPTAAPNAPRLLQEPRGGGGRLALDVVDYDEAGAMRFAGSAPSGSLVRLYVGSRHAGDAQADPAGRWNLIPAEQPRAGRHELRLDQLGPGGLVAARLEVPFLREEMAELALGDDQLIVQPGYSLWRISRRVYGRGMRYTVIYAANRERIRDPRRIYPGQVFTLPGTPAPSASNVSR